MAITITRTNNEDVHVPLISQEAGIDYGLTSDEPVSVDVLLNHRNNLKHWHKPKWWKFRWEIEDYTTDFVTLPSNSGTWTTVPDFYLPVNSTDGYNLHIQFNSNSLVTGGAVKYRLTLDGYPIDTAATLGDAYFQATGASITNQQSFSITHTIQGMTEGEHVIGLEYHSTVTSYLLYHAEILAWEIT